MPAIVEHIKKNWIWYAGGAAILVAVWYIRSRQQASAGAASPSDSSSFGAGATSPSAPASGGSTGAGGFADQLYQLQLQTGQESLAEQKALFGLQFGQQQQQFALQNQQSQSDIALQGEYSKAILPQQIKLAQTTLSEQEKEAGVAFQCPSGYGRARGPDGNLYCRPKSSGLPILGDAMRAISGFLSGVSQAAPSIGYQAANAAATYEAGQLGFATYPGAKVVPAGGGTVRPVGTPPISPAGRGPFGYFGGGQREIGVGGGLSPTVPRPISQGGSVQFSGGTTGILPYA